jgi:hypothetical protein
MGQAHNVKAIPGSVASEPEPDFRPAVIAPKAALPAVIAQPKTRKELREEIYALAQKFPLTDKELADWVYDEFRVESKDLTLEQLDRFLGMLTREITGA